MVQLTQASSARNLGVAVLVAKDQAEAFLMLETGRAAAYVLDDVQLAVAIARSKDPSVPPNGLNFRNPMPKVLRSAFANPSDSADPASYER
ncbi:hypothetical protein JQ620_21200 [Bradyrhizobium sp. AUGA SZCCT0274]|nr:hypothetical protein [Bradyrhizobium sp. AUGA SZCCT0274]MBR1242631.1 hypothetical protein [Bradyrhizobium sp. AUGA SZCCT0274]